MIPAFPVRRISLMSNSLTDSVCRALQPSSGTTLVMTVGNSLRSDDGIGPFIAEKLVSTQNLTVIDAGINPENYIDDAIEVKPAKIIIIDAAQFGGSPGEARVIATEHLPQTSLSTHSIPLPVLTSILEEDTQAEVVFLGIQAEKMEWGEGLSSAVQKTGEELSEYINKEYSHA